MRNISNELKKKIKIALLHEDLKTREHNNVVWQAQKVVYKEQLQKCQDIITLCHVPHEKDPGKNKIVMNIEKNTIPKEHEFYGFPYYVEKIHQKFINTKNRWFKAQYPNHNLVMEKQDNVNGIHEFNRFEEEGFVEHFQYHFRLAHIPRDAFYTLATPAPNKTLARPAQGLAKFL